MSDVQLLKNAEVGANAGLNNDAIRGTFRRTYSIPIANGTAATAVTESAFEHIRRAGVIKSISINVPINVVADPTNNATIVIENHVFGGSPTIVAQFTTNATLGNILTFQPFILPNAFITQSNIQVNPGDLLTIQISKNGTGVAFSAATSWALFSIDIEEN